METVQSHETLKQWAGWDKPCRPACPHNCQRECWRGHKPENGVIKTSCGACGRWIGYRPVGGGSGDNNQQEVKTPVAKPRKAKAA